MTVYEKHVSIIQSITALFFSLLYSLAMFYVIALAGAHKKVINQLREQLATVGLSHQSHHFCSFVLCYLCVT